MRTPAGIQDSPSIKYALSLLQRAWARDHKGLYAIIAEVESGQVVLEDPLPAMVIDYKRTVQSLALFFGRG